MGVFVLGERVGQQRPRAPGADTDTGGEGTGRQG